MNNPIIRLIIVHARENNDKRGQINRIRIPSRRLNTFSLQIILRLQKSIKIDYQIIYFIFKHLKIKDKLFNTELR